MKAKNNVKLVVMVSFFIIVTLPINIHAQQFDKLGLGLGFSTLGARLEAAMPINGNFNLRGGVSLLPFSKDLSFSISAKKYEDYIDYDPDLNVDGKISMFHAHVLSDYLPMKNGIFHFTAGFFLGSSKLDVNGILVNPKNQRPTVSDLRDAGYVGEEIPEITFEEDYILQPDNDGSIAGTLKLGGFIKPYLGLGLGRTIPKSKFGVKLELGMLYQGVPDISSPNLKKGNLNDYIDNDEDLKKYKPYFSWYPMLNFQLVYRIY